MRFRSPELLLAAVLTIGSVVSSTAQENSLSLAEILQGYSELYASGPGRGAVESILVEGKQMQSGVEVVLKVHKKQPDLIRYELAGEEASVVLGYDGERAWKQTRWGQINRLETLSKVAEAELAAEARLISPLTGGLFNPGAELSLEGTETVGDESAYRILVRPRRGMPARYFLSTSNYYLLKKESLDASGNLLTTAYYRNYQMVDDRPMAFEIETWIGGEVFALTRLSSIRFNSGVFNFYFEMPGSGGN